MADIAIITATAKSSLQEIGKQANALGTGLQNVAPVEGQAKNPSAEYLIETGNQILEMANRLSQLSSDSNLKPSPSL